MTDMAAFIAQIIALNGGELTGKTRLQKTVYFLERKNLGYGFAFEYHYYGPYSEDVAIAANDARARDLISVVEASTQSGDPYAVFRLKSYEVSQIAEASEKKRILELLSGYTTVVVELAATADFLEGNGNKNPWSETRLRKPSKATNERVELAKQLLTKLAAFKSSDVAPRRQVSRF